MRESNGGPVIGDRHAVDEALDATAALIRQAGTVTLACHVSPDGDAIGSLLAMHHLCRANGVDSVATWPEPFEVAPHYQFLPGLTLATKPDDVDREPELMLTFDCGSMDRLRSLADVARAAHNLVVVDHHASNTMFGDINLVDPHAAASTVMVRQLADRLGWPLNREAALCLYVGLITDTGRFQYSNTTPAVFDLARELVEFDLPVAEVSRELFEKNRFAYLQLVADVLNRAELDTDLGFVVAWVTADDFARHDVHVDEVEGLIDLVRRTAEAEVSCVLKEAPDGVRVSLRSIERVDVSAIAREMGGGGHRFAAGFTDQRAIPEIIDDIKSRLAQVV